MRTNAVQCGHLILATLLLCLPAFGAETEATSLTQAIERQIASVRYRQNALQNQLREEQNRVLYSINMCDGRLTLEAGVPISTTNQTAQSTVYFTPYGGNRIALYDGAVWQYYSFTERSIALSGLTSGKNYDVFIYDNGGVLTLELSAAWTTNSARADALAVQDGVLVKSGALTRRFLGTFRTTSTTTTEDTLTQRFLWNQYNRVTRPFIVTEATDSWAYTSTTVRSTNNSTANRFEFVVGVAGETDIRSLSLLLAISDDDAEMITGVDQGGTTTIDSYGFGSHGASTYASQIEGVNYFSPGLGYSFCQWVESGNTGGTEYGDAGDASARIQSGLFAFGAM